MTISSINRPILFWDNSGNDSARLHPEDKIGEYHSLFSFPTINNLYFSFVGSIILQLKSNSFRISMSRKSPTDDWEVTNGKYQFYDTISGFGISTSGYECPVGQYDVSFLNLQCYFIKQGDLSVGNRGFIPSLVSSFGSDTQSGMYPSDSSVIITNGSFIDGMS